jgi:hypothetical protein
VCRRSSPVFLSVELRGLPCKLGDDHAVRVRLDQVE